MVEYNARKKFFESALDEKSVDTTLAANSYITFCHQDDLQSCIALWQPHFELCKEYVEQHLFTAAAGSIVQFSFVTDGHLAHGFIIGLGKKIECSADACIISQYCEGLRRGLGSVIRRMESMSGRMLVLDLQSCAFSNLGMYQVGYEIITIISMASYQFDTYITNEAKKINQNWSLQYVALDASGEQVEHGMHDGVLVGIAVNKARLWCDTPPIDLTPDYLVGQATQIAQKHNLVCHTFNEEEIIAMGMGGLAGVARGSELDAHFVVMEYHPKNATSSKTVGLVGKGITFDSGGLSIKPAEGMETMKDDMAGAAVVIATMQLLAELQVPVSVIAAIPLAENLPGGNALKPGDIIRFYNGKTAEVKNTDAEGRLILADALSYITKHYTLDALFDVATLTGACAYAVGPLYAAVMGRHQSLIDALSTSGLRCGDRVWQLPFDDAYNKAIASDVADIANTGKSSYKAGTITAGRFLSHFVDPSIAWVHIDIASVAFGVPDRTYYRSGATGFGVRLFVDYIKSLGGESMRE